MNRSRDLIPMNIKEIEAKSILNKLKIFDYCINPYHDVRLIFVN